MHGSRPITARGCAGRGPGARDRPDPGRAGPGAIGAPAPAPGADRGRPAGGRLAGHRGARGGDPPGRRLGGGRGGGRARVRGHDRRGAGRAPAAAAPRHGRRPRGAGAATARPRRSRPRARGAHAGVPGAGRQDAGDRGVVGQGRCGQVDGDGEPGHRAGPGRPPGRVARRRCLRLLGAQDARDRSRSDHHRRHGDPDVGARRQVPLHGVLRAGRPAGDLARPDAAQGDPAVPDRCLLGGAGLRAHRHAARNRGRRARPWPR